MQVRASMVAQGHRALGCDHLSAWFWRSRWTFRWDGNESCKLRTGRHCDRFDRPWTIAWATWGDRFLRAVDRRGRHVGGAFKTSLAKGSAFCFWSKHGWQLGHQLDAPPARVGQRYSRSDPWGTAAQGQEYAKRKVHASGTMACRSIAELSSPNADEGSVALRTTSGSGCLPARSLGSSNDVPSPGDKPCR